MTATNPASDQAWRIKMAAVAVVLLIALVAVFSSVRQLFSVSDYSASEEPPGTAAAPAPEAARFRSTYRAAEAVWKANPAAAGDEQPALLPEAADPAAPVANLDANRQQAQARQLNVLQERGAASQDDLDADLSPADVAQMQQTGAMAW